MRAQRRTQAEMVMDEQETMEQLERRLSADAIATGDRRYVDDAHRVQLRVVALARGANASSAFENLYWFADHAALAVELAQPNSRLPCLCEILFAVGAFIILPCRPQTPHAHASPATHQRARSRTPNT